MDLFTGTYEAQLRLMIGEIVREELDKLKIRLPAKQDEYTLAARPHAPAICAKDLPLPGHERFFKPNGLELRFMVGEKYWHCISDLNLDQLEAACAIAAQWWDAETNRVTIAKMRGTHSGNMQPSECYTNAQRWRDYYQQEREGRK